MVALLGMVMATGCTITERATTFHGLTDYDGGSPTHLNTKNYAIHLLLNKPLLGDATLEQTVSDLTSEAKSDGSSKVRIVQSKKTSMWYLFFPFTIILTPVISEVAADTAP